MNGRSARCTVTSAPRSASSARSGSGSGRPISNDSKLQPAIDVVAGCTESSQSMQLGVIEPNGLSSAGTSSRQRSVPPSGVWREASDSSAAMPWRRIVSRASSSRLLFSM